MDSRANQIPEEIEATQLREVTRKVVIRYVDGRVVRGFITDVDELKLQGSESDSVVVESCEGNRVEVGASEVKAIFFVKSFEGSPDYAEFKVFRTRPNGRGVWVRAHFLDGEIIEGLAPNNLDTYSRPIFYMTPPDPASNNQAVLVSKRFLKEMQILGLASD